MQASGSRVQKSRCIALRIRYAIALDGVVEVGKSERVTEKEYRRVCYDVQLPSSYEIKAKPRMSPRRRRARSPATVEKGQHRSLLAASAKIFAW